MLPGVLFGDIFAVEDSSLEEDAVKRFWKILGGASAGACAGAATGASVAKYVLILDPSGTTPAIVISVTTTLGAIGGALGFDVGGSGDDDDD